MNIPTLNPFASTVLSMLLAAAYAVHAQDLGHEYELEAAPIREGEKAVIPLDPALTVAEVAVDWGFWHMGQFAADYQKQFGELPSETLHAS